MLCCSLIVSVYLSFVNEWINKQTNKQTNERQKSVTCHIFTKIQWQITHAKITVKYVSAEEPFLPFWSSCMRRIHVSLYWSCILDVSTTTCRHRPINFTVNSFWKFFLGAYLFIYYNKSTSSVILANKIILSLVTSWKPGINAYQSRPSVLTPL